MTTAETNTTDKAAAVAAQVAHVAPEKAANGAKQGARAKGPAPEKAAEAGAKASRKAAAPRAESKGAKILDMIARARGATPAEIQKPPTGRRTACVGSSRPPAKSTALRLSPQRMMRASAPTAPGNSPPDLTRRRFRTRWLFSFDSSSTVSTKGSKTKHVDR